MELPKNAQDLRGLVVPEHQRRVQMPNQFWKYGRYACFGAAAWYAAMQHGQEALHKQ
jgi:hypothetical protein